MAAALKIARLQPADYSPNPLSPVATSEAPELPEFTGVFRGRELTRKDRRLASGLAAVDSLIGGGIIRGRISEILAPSGAGKTSLAAAFLASSTGYGEVAAWIDAADNFDPESIAAAGVDLARMLWVSCRDSDHLSRRSRASAAFDDDGEISMNGAGRRTASAVGLKVAELILGAGGFGLVVIDVGGEARPLPQSATLRLARAAERSGAAVLMLASHRLCGTFAALSLTLRCGRACFSHPRPGAPTLFDGLKVEVRVARNKLGGSGRSASFSIQSGLADELPMLPQPLERAHLPTLAHIGD